MNFFGKNAIKKDHIEQKTFSYSRNSVRLNFTLRTDIKQELKDFLELLQEAEKEITEEIEKVSKGQKHGDI